jgi:hypothetical protein
VAVGDFNHDGKLDLAVTAVANFFGFGQKGFLDVLLGQGNGTFTVASVTPINSSSPLSVALADFNGDGNLDAAIGNSTDLVGTPGGGGISVLFGNGGGTFQETTDVYPGVDCPPMAVAVGDFDNNHTPDIVVTGFANIGGVSYAGVVSVSLSNGNGTFQAPQLFPVSQNLVQRAVAVGDFNRDGKLDIVTATDDDTISVLLGNGKGGFQSPLSFSSGAMGFSELAVGDFNGDGFPDLAVPSFSSNTVQVLMNSGAWDPPATITIAPAPTLSGRFAASSRTTATGATTSALARPPRSDVGTRDLLFAELDQHAQIDVPATPLAGDVTARDRFLAALDQDAQQNSGSVASVAAGWSGPQGPRKWLRNGVKSLWKV